MNFSLKFRNLAVMKMALKNKIDLSQEVLADSGFQHCMRSNDKTVVFHSSVMTGSRLDKRHNDILMGRNAVPLCWHFNSHLSDCTINSAFKKAYAKVVEYIDCGYDITPGRVQRLRDIISCVQTEYYTVRKGLANNVYLRQYLRNLNNLRMHCQEMTGSEIYDFSFDMVYDFIDRFSLSKETLSLSLLIMYWIQRESDLIPLAMTCDKDEFIAALHSKSAETNTEREPKKEFRLFMRKLLDRHLKEFIRNESKDSKTKETSRDRILRLIKDNPTHTAKTMASCLGLSVQAIQKQISNLKKEKQLERIGPDKGGRWKVIEKQQIL